ncbi:copper resistance protein NlpE [Aequorivita sp. SDUM287046]|uniref:Copper resistance protein NlpE n=1 Tax=Aequorivita aurantiaca TaxID=3053356 RepID=A0ABT8DCG0_9FLAO|nr:copper resistance protein NlpE [Aequorivita aurantiaca]MDN3722775.1 copper resistance protein NlpE [Aequorivita aurantiaca]
MKQAALALGISAILFIGCKNESKKEISSEETVEIIDSTIVDSHTSENSLDWAGVYQGTTPCADCEGIKTVLELKNDKTYILSQTYLGKQTGENEFEQSGNFEWDASGLKILLKTENDTLNYKVGENQLWMLDQNGSVVTGDLANLYVLKKTAE